MKNTVLLLSAVVGAYLAGQQLAHLSGGHVAVTHSTRQVDSTHSRATGHQDREAPIKTLAAGSAQTSEPTAAQATALDHFTLVSLERLLPAIATARSLLVAAYFLDERSRIVRAMATDAESNPNITTILTGEGEGYAVAANKALASDYPAFHVSTTTGPAHLKAIIIDNDAAYLGDRNFGADTLTLEVPTRDVGLINDAIDEKVDQGDGLMFRKDLALEQEAAVIRDARSDVWVESESFDAGSLIYDALEDDASRGIRIELLVKAGEAHTRGLDRRFNPHQVAASDKLVIVDNRLGWLGSANGTPETPTQRDWGYATTDPTLISQLRERFATNAL